MTGFQAPWEQKWAADQAALKERVAVLERRIAQLTTGPVACTSTTHPASPTVGMPIYETDTGLTAMWTGTAWLYPPQLLAQQTLSSSGSISLPVPSGGHFNTLRVVWTAASTAGGTATYMCARFNNDSGTNYEYQFNQANTTSQSSAGNTATEAQTRVGTLNASGGTSGYLGTGEFLIYNANGSQFKEPVGISNSINSVANAFSGTYGGQWLSTAAVTSIQLLAFSGSLVTNSTASLYGWT